MLAFEKWRRQGVKGLNMMSTSPSQQQQRLFFIFSHYTPFTDQTAITQAKLFHFPHAWIVCFKTRKVQMKKPLQCLSLLEGSSIGGKCCRSSENVTVELCKAKSLISFVLIRPTTLSPLRQTNTHFQSHMCRQGGGEKKERPPHNPWDLALHLSFTFN